MQRISTRKIPLFYKIDTTTSPTEPRSVTLGLRASVQPAKPASPIRLLCDQLPKVYVLSAQKTFTAFCALFRNRISHFKILAMP